MTVLGSIIVVAGAIAALAAVRAVQLARDLDDDRAERLSRALVLHGAAVLVLAASVLIGGSLSWPAAVMFGLLMGTWGTTCVVLGRAYDPSMSPEQRERQMEAARHEERLARGPAPAGQRFERPAETPAREGARRPT